MACMHAATFNVIQLGVGFFFIFLAFNTQGFIEEPVINSASDRGGIDKHAGYYSLAIIYAVFTFANFIAAPLVDLIGECLQFLVLHQSESRLRRSSSWLCAKWGMVLGGLCYTAFQAGFLDLNEDYLYISSAVLGFGAAVIWTGQGTYLSQNCTPETTGRNSAMLWGISQACLSCGGVFLFVVFHQSNTTDNIADGTVKILYGVFTSLTLLGVLIIALLRKPPRLEREEEKRLGHAQLIVSTFRLMFTRRIAVLAFVFAYTGIELSFWSGIYPTCISFTRRLGDNTNSLLALNAVSAGLGQITGGLLFGILGDRTRKIGRDSIVFLGACVHLVVFCAVYINFPAEAPLRKTDGMGGVIEPSVPLALICGGLLGFGDACWNTQIYSLLVDSFPGKSSQAFALFKFFQSALSCASFYYGSLIELQWHLLIMVVTSIIAAIAFFSAERAAQLRVQRDRVQPVSGKLPPPPSENGRMASDEFPPPPKIKAVGL